MDQTPLTDSPSAQDNWTGPKLLGLAVVTLVVALGIIQVIATFNGGH